MYLIGNDNLISVIKKKKILNHLPDSYISKMFKCLLKSGFQLNFWSNNICIKLKWIFNFLYFTIWLHTLQWAVFWIPYKLHILLEMFNYQFSLVFIVIVLQTLFKSILIFLEITIYFYRFAQKVRYFSYRILAYFWSRNLTTIIWFNATWSIICNL